MSKYDRQRPLRCAVVGVGHYGRFHAEKYAAHPHAELVAVVDSHADTGRAVADRLGVPWVAHHEDLAPFAVDAASVAVPASVHYPVARHLLERGVHILVEKPLTAHTADAEQLTRLAEARRCLLQVGHLERFSAPWRALDHRPPPQYVLARRLGPYSDRNTDVDVVLDLMIHDLDLIHRLIPADIVRIEAEGLSLVSDHIDAAWARLHFRGGAVADVTASRCAQMPERRLLCHWSDTWSCVDFQKLTLSTRDRLQPFEQEDLLALEIDAFLQAIRHGSTPPVTAAEATLAVATAEHIRHTIGAACHASGMDPAGLTRWSRLWMGSA